MSDILIKGMEMPKTCYDCYFCRTYDKPNQGYFCIPLFADLHRTDFTKKRIDACPPVEVPPHGRLIDADCCNGYFYEHMSDDMMIAAMNAINEMPTIIESEEVK